jgi:YVTN family beta-propeller protein
MTGTQVRVAIVCLAQLWVFLGIGSLGMSSAAEAAANLVFVANHGGDSISVIDAKRNVVVATISTPSPYGLAVSEDGKALFVTDFANHVSVFSTKTYELLWTAEVGSSPTGLALLSNRSRRSGTCPDGSGRAHRGCAYVTNYHAASVSIVDLDTEHTVATVPVGLSPIAVALSLDGNRAYVSNQESATVTVIDTNTAQVVRTIAVQYQPTGIELSKDGLYIYVVNTNGVLSIIDSQTELVVANVQVTINKPTFYVVLSANDNRSYITFTDGGRPGGVVIFDNINRTVVGTIAAGKVPLGLAITDHGRTLYVANEDSDTVSVIDLVSESVVATVPVGRNPIGLAVSR